MLYSKESIVNGFTEHDTYFLEMVYKDVYPSVRHFIQQNSGNKHDAKDIFQDGMIIVLNKVKNDNFDLCCSFKTFIFSVCKHVWLKKLRGQGFVDNGLQDEDVFSEEDYFEIDQENRYLEEYKLFKRHYYKMGKLCQRIIKLVIKGDKPKKIAFNMDFSSEGTLRQKLMNCKLKLLKSIKSDKKFQELKNEN